METTFDPFSEDRSDLVGRIAGKVDLLGTENALYPAVEVVDNIKREIRGDDDDADLRARMHLVGPQQRVQRVASLVFVKQVVDIV